MEVTYSFGDEAYGYGLIFDLTIDKHALLENSNWSSFARTEEAA